MTTSSGSIHLGPGRPAAGCVPPHHDAEGAGRGPAHDGGAGLAVSARGHVLRVGHRRHAPRDEPGARFRHAGRRGLWPAPQSNVSPIVLVGRDRRSHEHACGGALAIIIATGLLQSVLIVPKTPLVFRPSVQAVVAILIAVGIYLSASQMARRRRASLRAEARAALPLE